MSARRIVLLLVAILGCGSGKPPIVPSDANVGVSPISPDAHGELQSLLPALSGPQLAGQRGLDLADVESCGGCHPDAFAQQQASPHALASFNNPIYRAAVERLDTEAGVQAGLVCAGCHDTALLADGAMLDSIKPLDPRAHNGVSCRLCHGIEKAWRGGNGSFALESRPLPLPIHGDAASLARHKKAAMPPQVPELCGSCHESFLSEKSGNSVFLGGQDDMSSWANSAYAGQGTLRIDQVAEKDCVGCHMPRVPAVLDDVAADEQGMISSHGVLGAHTWMAAMRGSREQQQRTEHFLESAATLDVITRESDESTLIVDVVVRNVGTGHRFPGGARDVADTSLRLRVLDERGRVILHSAPGDRAHVLRGYVVDQQGRLLSDRATHHYAALVADHTIAPRDVAVVRYRGRLPPGRKAAHIVAQLVHRSRNAVIARATCRAVRSPRGRLFERGSKLLGAGSADGCVAPPTTVIASVERSVGDRGEESFVRMYEHGLGLLHERQERVGDARRSLQIALKLAAAPRQRAMALLALGQVAGRQGRIEVALGYFARAQALEPKAPSIAASRGRALLRVWRWEAAVKSLQQALRAIAKNSELWRDYALALASLGRSTEAFAAARRGLELAPQDADLLRLQALSLRRLGSPQYRAAIKSYLLHRGLDHESAIAQACRKRSARCALELLPVHEHVLIPR